MAKKIIKKEVVKKEKKIKEVLEEVVEVKTPTHEEILINKRNPRAGIVG